MRHGNDLMNQTRRRFRYNDSSKVERVNITNKQRMYKQILDDQLQQKRRRQSDEKVKASDERAWYVNPEESYHPYPITNLTPKATIHNKHFQEDEERPGYSRFITDPRDMQAKNPAQTEEDDEVKGYLEQCEKILSCLRGLTAGGSPIPSYKASERRFIKLNRSKNLLPNSNLRDLQDRYTRNYSNKLPKLSQSGFDIKNRREKMAIIVNPMPSTHKIDPIVEENAQAGNNTKNTKKVEAPIITQKSIKQLEPSQVKTTIIHSRNSNSPINDLKAEESFSKSDLQELRQRSKKSQLELNKERLTILNRHSEIQQHSLPVKTSSPPKQGQKIMTHLLRVKAHGYKLFEKMQRYKQKPSKLEPQINQN